MFCNSSNSHHKPLCRLEAEVQLVTPKLGGFADVRLRAALYEVNDAQPNGFAEAIPPVEVEITDQDHWISVDNTIKGTHAEAGVGGLAIVRISGSFALIKCCLWHLQKLGHVCLEIVL